jgi:hypothetical protein
MTTEGREPWVSFWLKTLVGLVIGVFIGAAGVFMLARDVIRLHDYMPVMMSAIYLLLGLTVWINPYVLRTAVPGERLWRRSAMMVAVGIALAAPVLVPPAVGPRVAFVLIAIFYAGGGLVAYFVTRRLDELTKRVIADTNQMAAKVIMPGIFLYGAAERLGLMPAGVSIWVLNGIIMWMYFVIEQFAWMRRGVDNPLAVGK